MIPVLTPDVSRWIMVDQLSDTVDNSIIFHPRFILNTPILQTGPLNSVYPLANIAEHGPFIEDLNMMIHLSNMVIFRKKNATSNHQTVRSPPKTKPAGQSRASGAPLISMFAPGRKGRDFRQRYGYGSIPINTIFREMNIHKSQLFWCEQKGCKVLTHLHMWSSSRKIWRIHVSETWELTHQSKHWNWVEFVYDITSAGCWDQLRDIVLDTRLPWNNRDICGILWKMFVLGSLMMSQRIIMGEYLPSTIYWAHFSWLHIPHISLKQG